MGQLRDADLHRRLSEENDRILEDYRCSSQMVTYAGIGPDLQDMVLSPDELLVQLVRGWDYLFDREPRLLRWVVEHQTPHFSWPPYPVLASPASPPQWLGVDGR